MKRGKREDNNLERIKMMGQKDVDNRIGTSENKTFRKKYRNYNKK